MRILITGFGPFPGAPRNPSRHLALRLAKTRRPIFASLERTSVILPTTWEMLAAIPDMLRDVRPAVVLMFGLAGRRRQITPESRAMNRATTLRPDAVRRTALRSSLDPYGPAQRHAPFSGPRLVAALKQKRLPARTSRDAGDYLCNALLYHVLASGIPALFVHIPRPRRTVSSLNPSLRQMELAGEIILRAVVADVRRRNVAP